MFYTFTPFSTLFNTRGRVRSYCHRVRTRAAPASSVTRVLQFVSSTKMSTIIPHETVRRVGNCCTRRARRIWYIRRHSNGITNLID